jgi:DeoR family fructose operon transcriptional repressor
MMALSGSLNAEARRETLMALLLENGGVLLDDAVSLWDVHPMTIRRDFDYLQRAGLARRVRGGLVSLSSGGFAQRLTVNESAKTAIAQKLSALVPANAAIGLDSSTTVYPLGRLIAEDVGLSVITNGLEVFDVLHRRPGIRSYLTGGEREERNVSLVGPLAIRSLESFHLEVSFISALSIHSEMGTSENSLEQAAVKDAMVRASSRVILGLDSSKLETRAQVRSLALARVDVLVTELDPSDSRLDAYRDAIKTIL